MEINDSGINLEIKEASPLVLSIPLNQSDKIIPLSFWLRITNNSKSSFFYNYGNLIPELFNQSGKKLIEKSPYNIIRQYLTETIPVGKTIGHKIEGRIFVLANFLQFEILNITSYSRSFSARSKNFWSFSIPHIGIYQLRFRYNISNLDSSQPLLAKNNQEQELISKSLELRIVKTLDSDKNGLEVDGVIFRTLTPEPKLITFPNQKGEKVNLRFGMQVVNQTPRPYHFIFFGMMPEFINAKGEPIKIGYVRNATRMHDESDYLLANPGAQLEFWVDAFLGLTTQGLCLLARENTGGIWVDDSLGLIEEEMCLSGRESSGGIWSLRGLKPGSYKIRFIYRNSDFIGKVFVGRRERFREVCNNLWVGTVITPFVEFQFV